MKIEGVESLVDTHVLGPRLLVVEHLTRQTPSDPLPARSLLGTFRPGKSSDHGHPASRDPRSQTDEDPPLSGHLRIPRPDLRRIVRRLIPLTLTAQYDISSGAVDWETWGGAEFDEARKLFSAIREGQLPGEVLTLKDGQRSLTKAFTALAARIDRLEEARP